MFDREEKETNELLREQLRTSKKILEVDLANMGFLSQIAADLNPITPTSISFTETSMLSPTAGNTLVFTGTLAPAGSVYPADTTFALVSSDTTVTPTVDVTGLIVTIPLPTTFVDNPASPFNVVYTATSISGPLTISATITPSIPVALPTSIAFAQTT
jgi:hypothetical protein